jgi:hypothetical protein
VVDFGDPCPALGTLLGFVALLFKDGVESFDASDVHVLLCPFGRSALPVLVLLAVVKLVVLFHVEGFGLVPEPVLGEAVGKLADAAGPSVEETTLHNVRFGVNHGHNLVFAGRVDVVGRKKDNRHQGNPKYEFFIHNRFNVLSLCKLAWDLSGRCYMYNGQSVLLP